MTVNLTVGIPRGLFWYYDPESYKVFWETFGFKVVQSPPTNREICETGLRLAHDELCLPVKVFHGHVAFLRDKVDLIFIPRIVSVVRKGKKRYGCPKFMGLPEIISNSVPSLPPIVSVDIDLTKGSLYDVFLSLHSPLTLEKAAIRHAVREMLRFRKSHIAYSKHPQRKGKLRIGVVGHPYILYDSYVSLDLLKKLSSFGVDYVTSAEIPEEVTESELSPETDLYWIYERKLVGAASFFANSEDVDAGLHCFSFGCGPGSVMMEIIQRKIMKGKSSPFFFLIMDEKTGETGLLTRLETFLDIVRIKKG